MGKPVPDGIAKEWANLLAQRALMYSSVKKFGGRDDFVRKSEAMNLANRIDVAALERFTETVFNVFIDLSKDLLAILISEDDRAVKDLGAEVILQLLEGKKVIDKRLREDLDSIREGRNLLLQHESSFGPAAAIWRMVEETNNTIDRAMAALQKGFSTVGYDLDMDLPEIT